MVENGADQTEECFTLRSRLSDIAQLSVWLDTLALRYDIPKNSQLAINLCLEEALSNIIRHGYSGSDDHSIKVRFTKPDSSNFTFIIDDEAPRFNPLESSELTPIGPDREIHVGGQGIRLLRAFADAVEYEPTAIGNRLRLRFSAVGAPARKK